jgi:hypothetical protein
MNDMEDSNNGDGKRLAPEDYRTVDEIQHPEELCTRLGYVRYTRGPFLMEKRKKLVESPTLRQVKILCKHLNVIYVLVVDLRGHTPQLMSTFWTVVAGTKKAIVFGSFADVTTRQLAVKHSYVLTNSSIWCSTRRWPPRSTSIMLTTYVHLQNTVVKLRLSARFIANAVFQLSTTIYFLLSYTPYDT